MLLSTSMYPYGFGVPARSSASGAEEAPSDWPIPMLISLYSYVTVDVMFERVGGRWHQTSQTGRSRRVCH